MADIAKTLKGALIKGMEAIGTAANNIASNTKYKMDEMTIINRRREILGDFGAKAYELWQKGIRFPAELEDELKELNELDIQLNTLRIQKLSNVEQEKKAGGTNEKDPAKDVPVIEVQETEKSEQENIAETESFQQGGTVKVVPLSDAIDELFDKKEDNSQLSEKVNDALDQLNNSLQEFSSGLGNEIEQLTEQTGAAGPEER